MVSGRAKFMAALLYGCSSIAIMFSNKIVLTLYGFPSVIFLAVVQFSFTIIGLAVAKQGGICHYPDLSCSSLKLIFPLPLFFLLNCIFGLSGTKAISLPMFTALRHGTILFLLLGETLILRYTHTMTTKVTVLVMISASIFAAGHDLSFDLVGYAFVLSNDFFTAANGITAKIKVDIKDFGRFGTLFYNSLVSLPLLLIFVAIFQRDQLELVFNFPHWSDPLFCLMFTLSAILGFVLNYAIYLATEYTSPLTVSIVGTLKNVFVTFSGMFLSDYVFEKWNFTGLMILLCASLFYSYMKFTGDSEQSSENTQEYSGLRCEDDDEAGEGGAQSDKDVLEWQLYGLSDEEEDF